MVTDLNGKVVDINPAWSATLGWSADDLVGDTAELLIHPDDRDRSFRDFVNEASANGAPHFQMRILHKDGSYRLLSWLAVRDRELIYAGARDITDLKQTQEISCEARPP
jgi:PAS domain S-box-containing protein